MNALRTKLLTLNQVLLLSYVSMTSALASNIQKVTGIKENQATLLQGTPAKHSEQITINGSAFILTICMIIGFFLFSWGIFQLRKEKRKKAFINIIIGLAMGLLSIIFAIIVVFSESTLSK